MIQIKKLNFDWLKNPITILISVLLGIILGLLAQEKVWIFKDFVNTVSPFGKMYLAFIQMAVIPILVTAIVSSVGSIILSKGDKGSLKKMIVVFIVGMILVSLLGAMLGMIGRPGILSENSRANLGDIINASKPDTDLEISFSGTDNIDKKQEINPLVKFFIGMVPANIFEALNDSKALELVFFSIIFGIALGVLNSKGTVTGIQGLFKSFQKIIVWAMYLLPFGLIILLSTQIANVGIGILFAMGNFIAIFWISGVIFVSIGAVVIWLRSGLKFSDVLKALMDPIIIAMATQSSFATLPSAINSLDKKLGFDTTNTNLVIPLGTTICRYGNILFFALATFFVVQIYGQNTTFAQFLIVIIGAIFAGMATAGSTGILTLTMINIILVPLGLPFEATMILFMAIDPIIDPMRTLIIVFGNMVATTFIARKKTPDELCIEEKTMNNTEVNPAC